MVVGSCACMFKFSSVPLDGTTKEYKISKSIYSDLLRTYCCDFLYNMYRQKCVFCHGSG